MGSNSYVGFFCGGEVSPSPHPSQLDHPRVSLHLDHAMSLGGWETLTETGLPSTWGKRIRGFWMQEVGDWAGPWLGLRKRGAVKNEEGR